MTVIMATVTFSIGKLQARMPEILTLALWPVDVATWLRAVYLNLDHRRPADRVMADFYVPTLW